MDNISPFFVLWKKISRRARGKDVWHAKLPCMFVKKQKSVLKIKQIWTCICWFLQNKIRFNFINKISISRFAFSSYCTQYLDAYLHTSLQISFLTNPRWQLILRWQGKTTFIKSLLHGRHVLHVQIGIKVSQLQIRNLELRKSTFLVQGPLTTSGKARKQIQVRTILGPEIFAT